MQLSKKLTPMLDTDQIKLLKNSIPNYTLTESKYNKLASILETYNQLKITLEFNNTDVGMSRIVSEAETLSKKLSEILKRKVRHWEHFYMKGVEEDSITYLILPKGKQRRTKTLHIKFYAPNLIYINTETFIDYILYSIEDKGKCNVHNPYVYKD